MAQQINNYSWSNTNKFMKNKMGKMLNILYGFLYMFAVDGQIIMLDLIGCI